MGCQSSSNRQKLGRCLPSSHTSWHSHTKFVSVAWPLFPHHTWVQDVRVRRLIRVVWLREVDRGVMDTPAPLLVAANAHTTDSDDGQETHIHAAHGSSNSILLSPPASSIAGSPTASAPHPPLGGLGAGFGGSLVDVTIDGAQEEASPSQAPRAHSGEVPRLPSFHDTDVHDPCAESHKVVCPLHRPGVGAAAAGFTLCAGVCIGQAMRQLKWAGAICIVFMVAEVVGGVLANSIAILTE